MTNGCLKTALSRITAQVSVIAIKEDAFFPLADIEAEQKLIPGSEFKVISSDWGHLGLFGVDPVYNAAVDTHLKRAVGAEAHEAAYACDGGRIERLPGETRSHDRLTEVHWDLR